MSLHHNKTGLRLVEKMVSGYENSARAFVYAW